MFAFRQTSEGTFFSTKHISSLPLYRRNSALFYCAISVKLSVSCPLLCSPCTWPLKLCHLLTCLMCCIRFQLDPVSKHVSALKKKSIHSFVLLYSAGSVSFFTQSRSGSFLKLLVQRINHYLIIFVGGKPLCPEGWDSLKWVHHSFLKSPARALLAHE